MSNGEWRMQEALLSGEHTRPRVLISATRRNAFRPKFANARSRSPAREARALPRLDLRRSNENAGGRSLALRHVSYLQQRLNCALPFQSSSSLDFFRFRGLNGITEIPKNFGLSRRPIQSLTPSKLGRDEFSLERR